MEPKNILMLCLLILFAPLHVALAMTYGQPRKTGDGKYIFYHWGADPWMSQMKDEYQFTSKRLRFFMSRDGAYGPGLYLADTPVGSYSYAGREGGKSGKTSPALLEVHIDHLPRNLDSAGWWLCTHRDGVTFHDFTGEGMEFSDHQWVKRIIPSTEPAYNVYMNAADGIFAENNDRRKGYRTFIESKLSEDMEPAELYGIMDVANSIHFDDIPLKIRTRIAKMIFLGNVHLILRKFQYKYDLLSELGKSLGVNKKQITEFLLGELLEVEKGIRIALALEIRTALFEATSAGDFVDRLQNFEGESLAKKLQSMLPPFLKDRTKIFRALAFDNLAKGIDEHFFNLPDANAAFFNQISKDLELSEHPLFPQILDKALAMARDLKELKQVKLPNHFMAFLFRKSEVKDVKKKHKRRLMSLDIAGFDQAK